MLTAYCYRVYPTDVQQQTLRRQFGSARCVYIYFLALQQQRYEAKKKNISFFNMWRELVELKRDDDYSWLDLTNAQSLYEGPKNLDAARSGY